MKLETVSGVAARVAEVGTFSFQNFFPNFFHEILKPPEFVRSFPFIQLNPHGFGILWATPVYLLIFPGILELYRRYRSEAIIDRDTLISLSCLLSVILIAAFIFMLSAHGFIQYSARYTLDYQIFLILFLAIRPGQFGPKILWGLLAISVYMNLVGAILFAQFFRKGIS